MNLKTEVKASKINSSGGHLFLSPVTYVGCRWFEAESRRWSAIGTGNDVRAVGLRMGVQSMFTVNKILSARNTAVLEVIQSARWKIIFALPVPTVLDGVYAVLSLSQGARCITRLTSRMLVRVCLQMCNFRWLKLGAKRRACGTTPPPDIRKLAS
jgi:hypothetical protein